MNSAADAVGAANEADSATPAINPAFLRNDGFVIDISLFDEVIIVKKVLQRGIDTH
jgi:hypothetical protein